MKTVQCSCGYVASGETAEELLTAVEAHIAAAHAAEWIALEGDTESAVIGFEPGDER